MTDLTGMIFWHRRRRSRLKWGHTAALSNPFRRQRSIGYKMFASNLRLTMVLGEGEVVMLIQGLRTSLNIRRRKVVAFLLGPTAAALLPSGAAVAADAVGKPVQDNERYRSAGMSSGATDDGDYADTVMLKQFTIFAGANAVNGTINFGNLVIPIGASVISS